MKSKLKHSVIEASRIRDVDIPRRGDPRAGRLGQRRYALGVRTANTLRSESLGARGRVDGLSTCGRHACHAPTERIRSFERLPDSKSAVSSTQGRSAIELRRFVRVVELLVPLEAGGLD